MTDRELYNARKNKMTDRELYTAVFENFVEKYNLTFEQPFNSGYTLVYKNGRLIGEFNIDGYNLLYNLDRLCKMLEDELI